jgi:hypothetical protein
MTHEKVIIRVVWNVDLVLLLDAFLVIKLLAVSAFKHLLIIFINNNLLIIARGILFVRILEVHMLYT